MLNLMIHKVNLRLSNIKECSKVLLCIGLRHLIQGKGKTRVKFHGRPGNFVLSYCIQNDADHPKHLFDGYECPLSNSRCPKHDSGHSATTQRIYEVQTISSRTEFFALLRRVVTTPAASGVIPKVSWASGKFQGQEFDFIEATHMSSDSSVI